MGFCISVETASGGTVYDLKEGQFLKETEGLAIRQQTAKQIKASAVYQRLLAAGQRLLTVIRHNEGGANPARAKCTRQLNTRCDNCDR